MVMQINDTHDPEIPGVYRKEKNLLLSRNHLDSNPHRVEIPVRSVVFYNNFLL